MKIVSASVEPCVQPLRDSQWKLATAAVSHLHGSLLVLTDENGTRGCGYIHSITSITTHVDAARAQANALIPLLIGRDPSDINAIMNQVETALAFSQSVKAGIDMALHDLLARQLNVPMHVLFGGKVRDTLPMSRLVPIKAPLDMARVAAGLIEEGYRHIKLKLAGDSNLDVARVREVRAAVGPDVAITLDPNQSYNAKQMITAFAKMEASDIALIEQPVPGGDWSGLKLITDTLPVAIEADETAVTLTDVLRVVNERAADVINLKITKLGGLRAFMAAVRVCEAGNIVCRMGTAFGPSLMQATSLHAAVTLRNLPFACELAEHRQLLDDPFPDLPVTNGTITLPDGPGCGIDYPG